MTSALQVTSGYLAGRVILLPVGRTLLVGSAVERDFVLFGANISRLHAKLTLVGDNHRLEALGENSIAVDGKQVKSLTLGEGLEFQLGEHNFKVHGDLESEPHDGLCHGCEATLGEADLGAFCQRCLDRRLYARRDIGDYHILRKVQTTDSYVSYLALDRKSRQRVTLRLLRTEHFNNKRMVRRFLSNAMAALMLSHPGFLKVMAIGSMHGACYVVMEQFEGMVKLERIMREETPLPPAEAMKVAAGLGEALSVGREKGFLVARSKPSGVHIGRDRSVKITSFELSPELELAISETEAYQDFLSSRFRLEETEDLGAEHGKLDRFNRESSKVTELGQESLDIYLLGRIFYQLLAGESYDPKKAVQAIIDGYGGKGPDGGRKGPLQEVPKELLTLLARLVTGDASKRCKTMSDALAALEKIRAKLT